MNGLLPGLTAIAVLAGIGWYNAQLMSAPIDVSPIPPERQIRNQTNASDREFAEPDEEDDPFPHLGTAFLDRPLFHTDRRPFVPPPPPPPAPKITASTASPEQPAPPPATIELRLLGVSISRHASRALVASARGASPKWLEPDAVIDGWRVKSISAQGIQIEADGRTDFVALYPEAVQ